MAPLGTRWSRLPLSSRQVLAVAVLHEGELRDQWLAEVANDPTAVDPLIAGRWLHEAGRGAWALAAGLDRAELRELVPWSQRRTAHLALARVLHREPAQLAHAAAHYSAGGAREEAGRTWLAAARAHCRKQRHRQAAECFQQAIQHLPETLDEPAWIEALRDFGTCASLQRAAEPALELLRAWREAPALAGQKGFQAEASRLEATLLERLARHVESAQARRRAADEFQAAGRPGEAAAERVAAATTLAFALHLSAAQQCAEEAVAAARALQRPDLEAEAATILGFCLGMRGDTAAGRAQLERALDLALGAGLTTQAADAYRVLGNVREYASCYHDVEDAFAQALSYCRRQGEDLIAKLCLGCLSYSLFRSGNWKKCAVVAQRVLADKNSPPASRSCAQGVLAMLHVHRGEYRQAAREFAASLSAARATGIAGMELFCLGGLAYLQDVSGSPDAAAATYRQLMNVWLTTEDRHDVVPGLTGGAVFFATRGDQAQAAEFAAALQRIASANPNPENLGAAALSAAELKRLEQRPAEAVQLMREAITAYERRELRVELMFAQFRFGLACQAAGDDEQARVAWRDVRQRALRLGARPLAQAAAHALASVASGGAPAPAQPPEPPGWQTLSPRQRDVARHVAAGRTNKEIATALGLSVRTVDMHVAHLLARLDCRTRTEATARLASRS